MEKVENPKKKNKSPFGKYLRWLWVLFSMGVLFVILIFAFANWGVFGSMRSFDDLENPESRVSTEIISVDGNALGKLYVENRVPVMSGGLPQHVVDALVATED